MSIQRYIFLYTTISQRVGFFPLWKKIASILQGRKEAMPPTLRPLISRHFPSHCMCLWGAEVLCVHSYKLAKALSAAAAAPPAQLSGWLPCWGTESNWSLSPHTAQKLGNFSARCRAVGKSTPISQGQGAQLEHRCRQGLARVAVGHVGSGMARKAAMCPRSQQVRNV